MPFCRSVVFAADYTGIFNPCYDIAVCIKCSMGRQGAEFSSFVLNILHFL